MARPSRSLRQAPRVKLAGTVLALVKLESSRQIRGRLHQLSFTGGLLHLETPLDEGIKVEVMFRVAKCTIRNRAVMMFPMWATQGCLQPFAFIDLQDRDREKLQEDLQKFLNASPLLASPKQALEATAGSSE